MKKKLLLDTGSAAAWDVSTRTVLLVAFIMGLDHESIFICLQRVYEINISPTCTMQCRSP